MNSIWAFSTWAAFFDMGGHGLYVWSSYGLFALLSIVLVAVTYMQFNRWKKQELRRLQRTRLQNSYQQKDVESSCIQNGRKS